MKKSTLFLIAFMFVGFSAAALYFTYSENVDQVASIQAASGDTFETEDTQNTSSNKPVAAQKSISKKKLSQEEILNEYPEIAERLEAMQERRPNREFDPEAVQAAMNRPNAWAPAEKVPRNLPLEPSEFTDGRQFIEFDSLKIETLMPGDNVAIAIDETGQEYQVTVDNIEKHDYNSISWFGHIQGNDGQKYNVSFTKGEQLTVGGLDTPEGHFVLQAHGDDGWIASSGLLFKIDPNVEDVVYPEDVMHQEEQQQTIQ